MTPIGDISHDHTHKDDAATCQEKVSLINESETDVHLKYELGEFAAEHQEVVLEWYNRDDNEIRIRRFVFNTITGSFGDWTWAEEVCPEWAERNEPTATDLATLRIGQLWRAPRDDVLWFDGNRFNLNLADTQKAFRVAWDGGTIVTDEPHRDFDTAVERTTYTPRIRMSRTDRDESSVETRLVFFEQEFSV